MVVWCSSERVECNTRRHELEIYGHFEIRDISRVSGTGGHYSEGERNFATEGAEVQDSAKYTIWIS